MLALAARSLSLFNFFGSEAIIMVYLMEVTVDWYVLNVLFRVSVVIEIDFFPARVG